jgi:hypothetical protein
MQYGKLPFRTRLLPRAFRVCGKRSYHSGKKPVPLGRSEKPIILISVNAPPEARTVHTETTETSLVSSILRRERRTSARLPLARPLMACPFGPEFKEEVQTTANTSRDGYYFQTRSTHYRIGMPISVVEGYGPDSRYNSPCFGRVVRVDTFEDGSFGIGVQVLMR